MALYQFVCSVAVMVVLSASGCYSDKPECGKLAEGEHPGRAPWWAVVDFSWTDSCLGFLVSDQWVMMSADCGYGNASKVHLGSRNNETDETNATRPMMVKEIRCSDGSQDWTSQRRGICLLKLSQRVDFTDYVSPICLASGDSVLGGDRETYIAGRPYGSPKKVPMVDERKCRCYHENLPWDRICSGSGKGEDMMDECQGGRGRLMMSRDDDNWVLTGVSAGEQDCESGGPQFYTSVAKHAKWIRSVTEEAGFLTLGPKDSDEDEFSGCPFPRECPYESPEDCRDDSIFGSAANMAHTSPFILLFVLGLSVYLTN